MNVELPNGTVIEGVPEGTTKEQIMQKAISVGLATAEDFGIQEAQPEQESQQAVSESQQVPGWLKPIAELAAASNKSIFQMLDFLGADNLNAVLQLTGAESRVPTLTGSFGSDGNYMEEGLARDAVKGAGMALPVAVGMTPIKGRDLTKAADVAKEVIGAGTAQVTAPVKSVVRVASDTVGDALPSKAKEAAKLPLYRQSGDVAAAGFKLDGARVVKDKVQQKALKAGLDEGAVAMFASANKATKSRLRTMVDVLEGGRANLEYRNRNTPQKVVGEALDDRLRIIQSANREAASRLDDVAKGLKNKPVDVASPVNTFMNDLASEGIEFNPNTGLLDFTDSSIEGLPEAQRIIKNMVKRIYNTKDPTQDALRVHNAKKFIDEQVSYGKSQAGLSGRMEGIIKRLRHNLDGILDSNFPEYDRVNTMYAETRSVIDELQGLAGRKVDLTGANVDKALGVMSRKVLSNYNTGVATEDLFMALDDVAQKYSTPLTGTVSDELFKLVSAEAEIRRMFPTAVKPNTLQGNVGMEVARTGLDAATGDKISLVKKGMDKVAKVFSKDDEAKIKALKELLAE